MGLICLSTNARNTKVGQPEKGNSQTNVICVLYTEEFSSAKLASDYKIKVAQRETIAHLRASKYNHQNIWNTSQVNKQTRKVETPFSH